MNYSHFAKTPSELFGEEIINDLADTGAGAWRIGENGEVCNTVASGIRVVLPEMQSQNEKFSVRLRYPIYAVHDHHSLAFREARAMRDLRVKPLEKEVDSLKSIISQLTKVIKLVANGESVDIDNMLVTDGDEVTEKVYGQFTVSEYPTLTLQTNEGTPDEHKHEINVDWPDYTSLMSGELVTITSSTWDEGGEHEHAHDFTFQIKKGRIKFVACTGCETDIHDAIKNDPQYEEAFTNRE